MLRKHAVLLDPAVAHPPAGGGVDPDTDFRSAPSSASWIAKITPAMTNEPEPPPDPKPPTPPKETKKEEPSGKTATAKPGTDGDAPVVGSDAKPADAKGKDDDEIDRESMPRNSADWDKYRTKYKGRTQELRDKVAQFEKQAKETETKLADLTKKLEQPKADPEVESKIKWLESKNAELNNALLEFGAEAHPDFKSHIKGQMDVQIAKMKRIVGDERAAEIEKLLAIPEGEYKSGKLDEIRTDLTGDQQMRLAVVLDKIDEIDVFKTTEIEKYKKNADAIRADKKSKFDGRVAAMHATVVKAMDDTWKSLQDPEKGYAVFQKRDGDDAWNAAVDAKFAQVKSMLLDNKMNAVQLARAAMDAVALPSVLESFGAAQKQWAEEKATFEKQVAEMSAQRPGGGSGTKTPTSDGGDPEIKPGMAPHERSKLWAQKMVRAREAAAGQ